MDLLKSAVEFDLTCFSLVIVFKDSHFPCQRISIFLGDDILTDVNLGTACFDRVAGNNCQQWRKLGYCSKSIIRNTVCRKSCGSCGGDTEDQNDADDKNVREEEESEDIQEEVPCIDQKGEYRCMMWRELGFCTHSKMRNTFCRKSCGACNIGKLLPLFFLTSRHQGLF